MRVAVTDPSITYAYFSKVEIRFPRATREENVEGAKMLLNRLLPVLLRDHWPDVKAAEQAREADEKS